MVKKKGLVNSGKVNGNSITLCTIHGFASYGISKTAYFVVPN